MKKTNNINDRKIVPKRPLRATNEMIENVVKRHKADADSYFITLVQWLKSGKANGAPIPQSTCDDLRNTMNQLTSLKAGIQPDWRKAIELMEREIKTSHKISKVAKKPSVIINGVLGSLTEISHAVATGKAKPDMLGRLDTILQIAKGLAESDYLVASVEATIKSTRNALRDAAHQKTRQKSITPARRRVIHDDKTFREECLPLANTIDPSAVALCILEMSGRRGSSPVELARKVIALGGIISPSICLDVIQLLEQEACIGDTTGRTHIEEDNIQRDGSKLIGLTGIVEGGESLGIIAQQIITLELKKHNPLTAAQRVAFETERAGLVFEKDVFRVIEEVKRIAEKFNWRPLAVAAHAAYKTPGIRPDIAGDVLSLLEQDEALTRAKIND